MVDPKPPLTPRHYKRLRWYFKSSHGAASLADGVDLDLAALGFVDRSANVSGLVHFTITEAGTKELSAENLREIERRRPHHTLAGRVSQWLRDEGRVTWENIEFVIDVSADGQTRRQVARPDVFSILTTLDSKRIRPLVHEIKVSRSDFLADVSRPEKRRAYQSIAHAFYYVAPAGIITTQDCPPECGLVVEREGAFEVIKKPARRSGAVELSPHQFLNLILKPGMVKPLVV